jgi:peptidoglycan/xylan/chitin deacetylase (PgdA/CDA1 family)
VGQRAILTYHSIDPSGSAISIDEESFARHVRWLASGTVNVTTLAGLLKTPADVDSVAITFDDGFENFGTIAWPMLREQCLPATLFVVSDNAGCTNSWNDRSDLPELALMDWETLGRLADQGLELGSHTRSHPRLPLLDQDQLTEEVVGSARKIEAHTGVRPTAFAYPYGEVSDRVEQVVSPVYDLACTTELSTLGGEPLPYRLPRLDAYYYRDPGRLEAWGRHRFQRRLRVRATVRSLRRWFTAGRGQ